MGKKSLARSANIFILLGVILLSLGVFGAGALSPNFVLKSQRNFLSPLGLSRGVVAGEKTEPTSGEFSLIIGKINLNVPVIQDTDGYNYKVYFEALKNGVAHFKGTALPDQEGNTVIFGHSSGLPWIPGNYKDVFAALENLEKDDLVTTFYKGKEYRYRVIAKKIVQKDDFSVLDQSKERILTLMTCYPFGFDKERLVVVASGI